MKTYDYVKLIVYEYIILIKQTPTDESVCPTRLINSELAVSMSFFFSLFAVER